MQSLKRVVPFFLLIPLLFQAYPALADQSCLYELEWQEAKTEYFTVIFSPQSEVLGRLIVAVYGEQMDAFYLRMKSFFESDLPLPPSIRIYPDVRFYGCLNVLSQPLKGADTHTHVGSIEVSLIEDALRSSPGNLRENILNAFRYEMAVLFLEHVTDNDVPPGLEVGVGLYAQDPRFNFSDQAQLETLKNFPLSPWRDLWERPADEMDKPLRVQAMSVVAYLVDVYGWQTFLDFLQRLPTSAGYREALSSAFGREMADLEDNWQLYYPYFLDTRWQANVISDFDLGVFENLLAAGAYTDAIEGLKKSIQFLENVGDTAKVAQAQQLLSQAEIGQEAASLVRQSRKALQDRDYALSIRLAGEARDRYALINDTRRLDELASYQRWAEQVLALRTELAQFENRDGQNLEQTDIERLKQIGARSIELGDEEGVTRVHTLLQASLQTQVNDFQKQRDQQRSQAIRLALAGGTLCLLLLLHRVWLSRRVSAPEAHLL